MVMFIFHIFGIEVVGGVEVVAGITTSFRDQAPRNKGGGSTQIPTSQQVFSCDRNSIPRFVTD